MKLINPQFKEIFHNLGIPYPETTLLLVAICEIACGTLIVCRLFIRQATILLLIIMAAAIYLTKIPIMFEDGIIRFFFEARLDGVMIMLLLLVREHVPEKV